MQACKALPAKAMFTMCIAFKLYHYYSMVIFIVFLFTLWNNQHAQSPEHARIKIMLPIKIALFVLGSNLLYTISGILR